MRIIKDVSRVTFMTLDSAEQKCLTRKDENVKNREKKQK